MKSNKIKEFIKGIPNFASMKFSDQIDIFAYYTAYVMDDKVFKATHIKQLYLKCEMTPYSNITSYLSKNSLKKESKFVKSKNGYSASIFLKENIEKVLQIENEKSPTNDLIDLVFFDNTRGYLKGIFSEANRCYDEKLFTSCLVMIRKGLEVLIIDLYEKRKMRNMILNKNKEYLFLSDLIDVITNDSTIKISRSSSSAFPYWKKYGDMAAHGKNIFKKSDIDKGAENLKSMVRELLTNIDYSNWK